ncbi:MAG: hypothetical protein ACXV5F_02395 [Halobacteriota archaeon]
MGSPTDDEAMNLKELLNTESILLVGDTYGSLSETAFSIYLLNEMLSSALDSVVAFICDGKMRGLAFKMDFWTLVTDIARQDSEFENRAANLFHQASCKNRQTYVVEADEFNQSVIALLSDLLVSGDACECAGGSRSYNLAYSPERQERIQLLFKTKVEPSFNLTAATILELGCGNGMATAALRELDYNIYAFDSDKCAVCEGLLHGALQKEKTLVLDGRYLSRYDFSQYYHFNCIVGFMLGAIYEFNKAEWETILLEAATILTDGLFVFTVHKKEEADFVRSVMDGTGVKGELVDNRSDTSIYDQWVYVGVKGDMPRVMQSDNATNS